MGYPLNYRYFYITDDSYRDLELRWVEVLSDGSEGLATPYFDTYFNDVYKFNLQLKPDVNSPQKVCISDQCSPA